MALIDINRNPSRRELLWFGGLLVPFFGLVSGMLYARYGWPVMSWIPLAAACVVSALFFAVPAVRRPIYLAWMYATMPIGFVVSLTLLAAIYYLVFTPMGLLMRLCGRDRMHRRFDRQAASYWIRRPPPRPAADYFRQF